MAYTPSPQLPTTYPDLPEGSPASAAHDRTVLDAVKFLATAASAIMDRRPLFDVEGTSNTTFVVRVGSILGAVLKESGLAFTAYAKDPGDATLSNVAGSPANLSNSRWYFVYLKVASGAVSYEIVDGGAFGTPIDAASPDVSLRWKNATSVDTSRRYLGCFPTTSAGVPRWITARNGRYVYRTDAPSFTVSNDGTGFTEIDLASVLPPHVRVADVMVMAGTDGATLDLRTPSSGSHINVARGAAVPITFGSLRTVEVRATTSGNCVISVRAFEEG